MDITIMPPIKQFETTQHQAELETVQEFEQGPAAHDKSQNEHGLVGRVAARVGGYVWPAAGLYRREGWRPKLAASVVALGEIGILAAGVSYGAYEGVVAPQPDAAKTLMCTDNGHEMVQIGGNNWWQNGVQKIVNKPASWLHHNDGSQIVGPYNRTTQAVADRLSIDRNYGISPQRLAIANPDLFSNGSTKPLTFGAMCIDVPPPISLGTTEADGKTSVKAFMSKYHLSADEFAQLNPRLSADAKPAAGTEVTYSPTSNQNYVYTKLPTSSLGQLVEGLDAQQQPKALRQIVVANMFDLAVGKALNKGDNAYVPSNLLKPSYYMNGYGMSPESIKQYYANTNSDPTASETTQTDGK